MLGQGNSQTTHHSHVLRLLEGGYTVLTPNFRLSRDVAASWDQKKIDKGQGAWTTPKVFPLENWLMEQWQTALRAGIVKPLLPTSAGAQVELWQEVIATHERATQGFNLIRPTAAAAAANKARDTLLRWQVDSDDTSTRQLFELDEDCGTFLKWQSMFDQRLAQLGMQTENNCLVDLLGCAGRLPKSKLVLHGFDEIPPLLRSCVEALAGDLQELDSIAHKGECVAYQFPDKRTELAALARWVRQLNQADASQRIGIIVPNMAQDRPALEYLLRREFGCLGTNYTSLPVNFSAGIALDRVPMVRDALLVLGLAAQRVPVDSVVRVLRSRFLHMDDVDSPLAMRFIKGLFNAGSQTIEAGDLRYRASRPLPSGDGSSGNPQKETKTGLALGQILLQVSGMRELRSPAQPSQWAQRFSSMLELWGWPGKGPLDSIEYQQLQVWYTLLDDYCGYDATVGQLSYEEALGLLTRCCARQVSQPQTPDSNIQVLGLLEAASLSFDAVWICDMQASNWPAAARPNPFIPIGLQREMKMPNASAEREWIFASQLMSRYISSSPTVFASFSQFKDAVPEKPSALLEGFEWRPPPHGDIVDGAWLRTQSNTRMEYVVDAMAPAVDIHEQEHLGGGSGLLEDQSHCPFRAFSRRRLGITTLGEPDVALSAAERGSLLHDALYQLWGQLHDSATLAATSVEDAATAIAHAVDCAIDGLPVHRRSSLGHAYFELEGKRLRHLLQEWLEVERQRSEFSVLAREKSIDLQVGQLNISLRIDRIDQLPDGAQFVIDYKSGRSSAQDWLGERPSRPQLTLYGLAMNDTVAGLAFAQVRRRECKYVGAGQIDVAPGVESNIEKLVKEKMPAKDWDDLTALWRDNLERLATEFVAGDAQVDPLSSSSCTYCGLQALCRVGEL